MKSIQVIETSVGWNVRMDQGVVFSSLDEETAFKRALDISSGLFDRGTSSQVSLERHRAAPPHPICAAHALHGVTKP